MSDVSAWHFTGDTLRDGRPIPAVGEWLKHEGEITIYRAGLHASEKIIDALQFAVGRRAHRVTMRGIEDKHVDQLVARERRIDWSIDAEPVLRSFTRRCALDVLPLLPDSPAIVRQYLETGDENIRDAAMVAAVAAALATRATARTAAWAAARAAATDDAPATARAALRAAARTAASRSKYNDWLTEMVEAAR